MNKVLFFSMNCQFYLLYLENRLNLFIQKRKLFKSFLFEVKDYFSALILLSNILNPFDIPSAVFSENSEVFIFCILE